jgi:hypothetical protein
MGRTTPQNDNINSQHDKIERDIKKEKRKPHKLESRRYD